MDRLTRERYVERAVWPIGRGDRNFWVSVAVLSALVLAGLYAWIYQLQNGLGVTGLNQKVSWASTSSTASSSSASAMAAR